MSFGVGAGAFAQGFLGGYKAVQEGQARDQENEIRKQQLDMQKAQAEQQKAYMADMSQLSEQFKQQNTVQAGVDAMGNPVTTTRPMTYEQQMQYASAAADISMRHMKLKPDEFMQIAKIVEEGRKEGTMDAVKALHAGDIDGAIDGFNRSGKIKIQREDVVGVDQIEADMPGGIKMPAHVLRLKDGTEINSAKYLMTGVAFEKMYDAASRRQEAQEGRTHDERMQAERIAAQRAEGAADRATRIGIASADRQASAGRDRSARLPAEVLVSQWYANDATPAERAAYDALKRRNDKDEVAAFEQKLVLEYAGAFESDPIGRAKGDIERMYPDRAPTGYGTGQPAPAAPAPAAARPTREQFVAAAMAKNPGLTAERANAFYDHKHGAK